jgi:L-lactate dehydrogenase complex protein LldF
VPVPSRQQIDLFAARLSAEVKAAVADGTTAGVAKRAEVLAADYDDADRLRRTAGRIRQHALDHLDEYLPQAEARLAARGVQVHFAWDTSTARELILRLIQEDGGRRVAKSKSMVSEELDLARWLNERGVETVETDLGELIVQLDDDHPSHVVKPIIHKNRREIANTFETHGLGDYDDEPETITRRAREWLRPKFLGAEIGITGANFISAESGRAAIVTNEGNARFSLSSCRTHILITGIEKIVPRDRDLALLLALLGRSATGQRMTSYVELVGGPRAPDRPAGPENVHVVFLNNHRTEVLASDCRQILRCIRCGACMNICPVYRQTSGHAYRQVYPGPVGAVLDPLLAGPERFAELADLPRASTLCGACSEVCPVDIPLHDLLVRHRTRAVRQKTRAANLGTPGLGAWARIATMPSAWRASMRASRALNHVPLDLLPLYPLRAWLAERTLPEWRGGRFRAWMEARETPGPSDDADGGGEGEDGR